MTNPPSSHFEAALTRDIDLIRTKVLEMAALDEQALTRAFQAFLTRDRQLAYSVILRDQDVDALETELDRLCLEFIVRHQPAAGHLRFVYSASKIVNELERVRRLRGEHRAAGPADVSSLPFDVPARQVQRDGEPGDSHAAQRGAGLRRQEPRPGPHDDGERAARQPGARQPERRTGGMARARAACRSRRCRR